MEVITLPATEKQYSFWRGYASSRRVIADLAEASDVRALTLRDYPSDIITDLLGPALAETPGLSRLVLSDNQVEGSDPGVYHWGGDCRYLSFREDLFESLRLVPRLTHLTFRRCGVVSTPYLVAALRYVPLLTHLDLSEGLEGTGYEREELGDALTHLPCLSHLSLRRNSLGNNACRFLAPAVESLPALTHLDLAYNRFTRFVFSYASYALDDVLRNAPHLQSLDLSYNLSDVTPQITRSLAWLPSLTELRLRNIGPRGLRGEGTEAVARALHHVPRLTVLDLSYNRPALRGYRALGAALPLLPHLTTLTLTECPCGITAFEAITSTFRSLPRLRTVSIPNCDHPRVSRLLLRALVHVPDLTQIYGTDYAGSYLPRRNGEKLQAFVRRLRRAVDFYAVVGASAVLPPEMMLRVGCAAYRLPEAVVLRAREPPTPSRKRSRP